MENISPPLPRLSPSPLPPPLGPPQAHRDTLLHRRGRWGVGEVEGGGEGCYTSFILVFLGGS